MPKFSSPIRRGGGPPRALGNDGLLYTDGLWPERHRLVCRPQSFWEALRDRGWKVALQHRAHRPIVVQHGTGRWVELGDRESLSGVYELIVPGHLTQLDLELIDAFWADRAARLG